MMEANEVGWIEVGAGAREKVKRDDARGKRVVAGERRATV